MSGAAGSASGAAGSPSGGSNTGGVSGQNTGGSATGGVTGGSGGSGGAPVGGAGASTGGASGAPGGAGAGGTPIGGAGQGGAGGLGGQAGGGRGGATGGAGMGGKAGAGGSGGGSGGGGAFDPCPATGACKILPLGDSITDGVGVTGGGGYRIELFRLARVAGKNLTFVGSLMNGPQMVNNEPFPRMHEGHSGWRINQIDDQVPTPYLNPDPHIILLHIGTNDIAQGQANGAPDRLAALIDQILMDQPNSLLVVAQIIPFNSGVQTFNAAIPAIVTQRANAGRHIILVDQFTGFPTSELADGVHPNTAGYVRMATKWYAAISSYLH